MKKTTILLLLIIMGVLTGLNAQERKKDKLFKIDGNLGLFYDMYDYNTTNYPTFRPRYEDNIVRFTANANIQIGKHFSLPFGINISNRKTSYNLPNLPDENLFSYVQNPRNNIHLDPTYKWVKWHLGSHTPDYSTLTTGDIQIFGVGVDINPGKFILSANYGKSQIAIEPDILLNVPGAYKQNLFGARIGFGKVEGSKFTFNFVKIKDDVNSVITQPIGYDPIEGITISPLVEVKMFKKLTLKTETAASIYTNNLLAGPMPFDDEIVDAVSNYVTVNSSSVADFSHATSLQWKAKAFLLGGEVKYIGPGFTPVGYRNIEKDIIDYKINTGFKLFKKKLDIKGMFGVRTNNIKNTTLQSTKRIISNMNLFAQVSKAFSVNVNYNNFGFRNNLDDNTLRVEMVNNSLSIAPSYQIQGKTKQHLITAVFALNNFEQYDTTVLDFITTDSKTYNANYMLIFKNIPLNIGLSGMYLQNRSSLTDLDITNYGISAGYRLFKKKLRPSISVNYATVARDNFTPDKRINTKIKLKYKINKKMKLKVSYSLNNNKYGDSRPGAILNENKIQFSILKKL